MPLLQVIYQISLLHFSYLIILSFQGHVDVVRLLIDYGAALNNEHTTMYTPLTLAASEGKIRTEMNGKE